MAEFLTMEDADHRYGKKGVATAGLTTGIIGTALASGILGNNGCNGGGGILGGLFGNNNQCLMGEIQEAKTMALLQGQQADNLAWANRVASMQDTAALASNLEPRLTQMNNQDWINRIKSMEDDAVMYVNLDGKIDRTRAKLSDEVQLLTNQTWMRREEDLKEKTDIYVRGLQADQALAAQSAKDKFDLYKMSNDADNAIDSKFTKVTYESRIDDLKEKSAMFNTLASRISELEKAQAKTETALPLMFELTKVKAEKYTDDCCCASKVNLLNAANDLQRQIDHKIDGKLKYSYSDLCAPVPNISPLYCSPFTTNGSGTVWNGFNGGNCNGCQTL